ncbi:uncharacterized protein LOC135392452 [Ornithodoros turicata]|uniref:uncharacterized protein LOC135392452 n=1 Tax=Ornithodoros turicata TaxID=34597 RepID=UPI0031394BB7
MKQWGVLDRHAVPYRPAGQVVERHNAVVKQSIMVYCHNHRDWDKHLQEIAFAMRTSESTVTGYTPAFRCYERELRTSWTPSPGHRTGERVSAPEYGAELSQALQSALDFARSHQGQMRLLQEEQYNRSRQPIEFAVGDRVLRDCHILSNACKGIFGRLAPRRDGPYVISARVPSTSSKVIQARVATAG